MDGKVLLFPELLETAALANSQTGLRLS